MIVASPGSLLNPAWLHFLPVSDISHERLVVLRRVSLAQPAPPLRGHLPSLELYPQPLHTMTMVLLQGAMPLQLWTPRNMEMKATQAIWFALIIVPLIGCPTFSPQTVMELMIYFQHWFLIAT